MTTIYLASVTIIGNLTHDTLLSHSHAYEKLDDAQDWLRFYDRFDKEMFTVKTTITEIPFTAAWPEEICPF